MTPTERQGWLSSKAYQHRLAAARSVARNDQKHRKLIDRVRATVAKSQKLTVEDLDGAEDTAS